MTDVHGYSQTLQKLLSQLRNSEQVSDDNRLHVLKFQQQCTAEGLSPARIVKYIYALMYLSKLFKKDFRDVKKEDVISVVQRIESRSDYSDWTKRDYKVALKKFFKWLRGEQRKGIYPEEVSFLTTSKKNHNTLPEDILTEDEIKKLSECASHPRDKALVQTLYESGCRVGEILPLKIKNIQRPDDNGFVVMVSGKTGSRRIRLISSSPALASWLDVHPMRDDPDAHVWLNLSTNNLHEPLGYPGVNKLLKEIAARAKIKKRVNPHAFRHARATFLANHLTEAQMKELFGWTQSSDMAAVYVHLSGRDVDNTLLQLHGLASKESNETKFKLKICPRCDERNSPDAKYCKRCALTLDAETMEWENELMDKILSRPQAQRLLTKLLKEAISR